MGTFPAVPGQGGQGPERLFGIRGTSREWGGTNLPGACPLCTPKLSPGCRSRVPQPQAVGPDEGHGSPLPTRRCVSSAPRAALTPRPQASCAAILPKCLESSPGSRWLCLPSTTRRHFCSIPLSSPRLLASSRLPLSWGSSGAELCPSQKPSPAGRSAGVLREMPHRGTLRLAGGHRPVLLRGSAVLRLRARSPDGHRAADRDLLLQKLPGL